MKSYYPKLLLAALVLGLGLFAQGCAMPLDKDAPGKPGSHPNAITLTRQYQHVQRYNCDGSLRDDGIESIQEPTKWVSLSPNYNVYPTGIHLTNRQNGDTSSPVFSSDRNYEFLVKYNTGEGGLKVERGLNIVDYQFYGGSTDETGTVSFDVTYIEQTLSGTSVQHIACPSPTPSP
jgi:hypothetical protein